MSTSNYFKVTKIMFSDIELDGHERRKRRNVSDLRHNNLTKNTCTRIVNELRAKYHKKGKGINRDHLSIVLQVLEVVSKHEFTSYHDICYACHLSNQLYDEYMSRLKDYGLIQLTLLKAKGGQKKVARRYSITPKGHLLLQKIYTLKHSGLITNDPFNILPMTLEEYTEYRKTL